MEEEIIYTWLLIHTDGTWDNAWSKAKEKPSCGDENYEWVE